MARKHSTPDLIESKRNLIFLATRKLLARQAFHDLKMDDIAQRAGIAKGSLYLYFKDKESLYSSLVQSLFDKLPPRILELMQSPREPRRLLRDVLETQVLFFEEHLDVFVHFFREGPGPGAHQERLRNSFRRHVENLATVIKQGIIKGQFRHVNPVKAAIIMVGLVRSAIVERIHGFTKKPISADIDEIWNIYMKGIGA